MRAASAARSHNRARYYADRARVLRAKLTWQCHRNHQKAGRAQAYRERRRPSSAAALEGSRYRAISAFTDALSPTMKAIAREVLEPALHRAVLRSRSCISGVLAFGGPAKVACSVFFTTRREATPSCLLPRNTGSGISGHTSRGQTHQSRHAGYPRRNLGRSGGIARVGRAVELRRAMRGSRMPTNLQAPQASFASD